MAHASPVELKRETVELNAVRLLVGAMAHDFNNLLTAISGHAALIEADAAPGSDVRQSATAILKAAEHAAGLAVKLQDISRRGKTRREPVDLHAVVAEVAVLLKPTIGAGIVVEQQLGAFNAATTGDPEQLHQMVLNLALNARDSMPEGGRLTFETRLADRLPAGAQNGSPAAGPWLVLAVRDTGHGIAEEIRARIFEPFFTTRAASGGTGLGLTVVAGVARRHKGHLEVESAPGQGSVFRVYLPVALH